MSKVYVGTSGWVYKHWIVKFYPEDLPQKKWLEYFSARFKTVEINSTFYHSAKAKTYENWAKTVPKDFIFAIKANRFLTHIKRLKNSNLSIHQSIDTLDLLGDKLGPVLFQLPSNFKRDDERLESFLKAIRDSTPNRGRTPKLRVASEFRHKSWFDEEIYGLLRKNNVALVIAESSGRWPSSAKATEGKATEEVITADFTYIRFHGALGRYSSKYSDKELKEWASKIRKWMRDGVDVYAYFNNDNHGYAVENAKTLLQLVS